MQPDATTTGEGSTALGFYNVQQGDVPYFKSLADKYAMSDNFHQSVNGGTGANHIMFGHADAIWFSNADGSPGKPPQNTTVYSTYNGAANPDKGVVQEIENPNPAAGHQQLVHRGRLRHSQNAAYRTALHGGARFRRRLVQRLLRPERARRAGDPRLPRLARAPDRSALRAGTLLSAEQLQPRLLRQRQECLRRHESGEHAVHHSALIDAQHRR